VLPLYNFINFHKKQHTADSQFCDYEEDREKRWIIQNSRSKSSSLDGNSSFIIDSPLVIHGGESTIKEKLHRGMAALTL
jgi:hypothetical protein